MDLSAGTTDDDSSLWRALADPTRRRILDLLRERPRITGDIASQFAISRIAVMRHLEVLSTAGLVANRKRGRERWHYLNSVPLERIHKRWFDPHAAGWAAGLVRLGEQAEAGRLMKPTRPVLDIALDVAIAAAPSEVFFALTRDPGAWWGHPYLRASATGLTLDLRLGGKLVETWEHGGAVVATVTGWTDDVFLELTGPFHLGVALAVATFQLTAGDLGTKLSFTFRAIGAIDAPTAEQFTGGWTELVSHRLKTFAETGARLGVAPDPPAPEAS
jgi:DNA-binding transcriptional ArsR family regulator/uncharacterized protein YndB with AHSA1/START domain